MVVKEDGTKWACASCLKGHRVSGCTHTDRELTFVPKKGRPVTQCPHCRSERKKRSAHVKCECGDKTHSKEKCIHLREAEAKAAAASGNTSTTHTSPESDDHHSHNELCSVPEESLPEGHQCCCPHGGKCTCATLNKESPEPRSETPPNKTAHARPKHQLKSHQSEGHLTIFANGHHKPVHRNNNAAHESGVPYKIPRAYSAHGPPNIARRSVDSLASAQSVSPVSRQQRQSVPISAIKIPQGTAKARSERGSPHSGDSTRQHSPFHTGIPMENNFFPAPASSTSVASNGTIFQDFGFPSTQSALSITTSSTEPSMSAFSMPASGLDFSSNSATDFWANVDWDRLDSTVETQPALTNASSGTISEIDDLPRIDDLTGFDAQFPMDGPAQIPGYPYSNNNDFSSNENWSANVPSSILASSRWSMPAYSSQPTTNASSATLNSEVKDGSIQNFATPQNQSLINSGATSIQSHSPGAQGSESGFQSKAATAIENYDWDNLMPDYSSATVVLPGSNNMNDSVNFGMGGAEQASASAMQGPPNGNLEGFNNSYRTMQWDDGMSIPADQDFVGSYTFESNNSNWPNGSFNASWGY